MPGSIRNGKREAGHNMSARFKRTDLEGRIITHDKDVEYFTEYPAPIMELIHSSHFTNVNSTITFYGPMLYFLARAIGAEQVLEIGHAEGYSSYYLASAVKDNGVRFGMEGNHYYGIDIVQVEKTAEKLKAAGLPATCIEMDSGELNDETFEGQTFDIIFQDGAHDEEHIVHEFKTLWPKLKGKGKGLWIAHDVFGPGQKGCRVIKKMIDDGDYQAEYIRLFSVYGLMIIRKLDNWDESKNHWWQNDV